PYVEQTDVDALAKEGQRFVSIGGLGDDRDAGHPFQKHPDALTGERLVVGDENADHAGAPGSVTRTRKPAPGRVSKSTPPPNSSSRRRMPSSPCPAASCVAPPTVVAPRHLEVSRP